MTAAGNPSPLQKPVLTPGERVLVEAVAERVVERLRTAECASHSPRLVDARAVAEAIGISRDTVYAYAEQLGGHRLGNGPRGRLRFDLDRALAAWGTRTRTEAPVSSPARASERRVRRRRVTAEGLLPIRGSASRERS
jgi:hypothetical protein